MVSVGRRCGQAGARWLARRAKVPVEPALCSSRRASVANGPWVSAISVVPWHACSARRATVSRSSGSGGSQRTCRPGGTEAAPRDTRRTGGRVRPRAVASRSGRRRHSRVQGDLRTGEPLRSGRPARDRSSPRTRCGGASTMRESCKLSSAPIGPRVVVPEDGSLIKRSRRRTRGGRSWACRAADGALWTPTDVTALLSPLLSRLGSRDCFRVSDLSMGR
jgi:hypothetical protein